jgi:hypothetical protein
MRGQCFNLRCVLVVAAIVAMQGATAASGSDLEAERDFLAKAKVAMKAIQENVKDDKILSPIAKGTIEEGMGSNGESYLTIGVSTPESWPNFPSKPKNLDRGYGRLRIDVYANQREKLPITPFMPPPGCFWGTTYLIVPNTPARILVETTTSDPAAQRRLVDLAIKEFSSAGITARLEVPDKEDIAPCPVKTSPPAGQSSDIRP